MSPSPSISPTPVHAARPQRLSLAPAAALFFAAPLVAEFLLGNLPIRLLPALVVLAPMYGGGALLIREIVRRTGRGWPSILLLGMAYALLEEAYTTQSLFNPDYLGLHLHLLAPAWIPALGIGGWWTLWMLNVHALWSISTPIALIEATVPSRARTPWLGPKTTALLVLVFLFGLAASTGIGYRQDHYLSTRLQFLGAALVIVALVTAAFFFKAGPRPLRSGSSPSPWITGAAALLFGSAAELIPMSWNWGAFAALLALDLVFLLIVRLWLRYANWGPLHVLSLAAGAALAYGWHSFVQHPAIGPTDAVVRVGNAIFLAAALAVIALGFRRTRTAARSLA